MIIEPKGIKRNASLLHDQDGACNEIINFRYKDEEWESIQPGTLKATFAKVISENFTSSYGVPVALANSNLDISIIPVVKSADGLTTYVAETDYTIDYVNGTITVLSNGTMADATSYLINYTFTFTVGDILFRHNILSEDILIYWNHLTGNLYTISIATGTILVNIASETSVLKITEFGILLVVITDKDIKYLKYDVDSSTYITLSPLEHGRYTFGDLDREQFGKTYDPGTSYVETGITAVSQRKQSLEQAGKTNGHVFFRVAFKTVDGNFVNYSPIYYRNIGYSINTDGTTDAETIPNVRSENISGVTTYYFSWGDWAAPSFAFSFTNAQLENIAAYEGIVESICVFMTKPFLDWDANSDKGALMPFSNTVGTDVYAYNFYPHTGAIADFFAQENSFYLVQEIPIDQLADYYLKGVTGGTFTSIVNTAVALPNPPATITKVVISLSNYLGNFTYVEDTDYTIDYTSKTITVLAARSVYSYSIYLVSIVVKFSLGQTNLFAIVGHDINGVNYPDTDFSVDLVNGTVRLLNSALLHTTVYFDFSYGMENGTVYTATFTSPLQGTLGVGDISTLETRVTLPVDSFTHHKYFSKIVYEFNSRLHIGDLTTKFGNIPNLTVYDTNDQGHLPAGYTKVQDANNQTWTFFAVVTLKTDNGLKTVVTDYIDLAVFNNGTDASCLNQLLMYPDQRAKTITFLGFDTNYKTVMKKVQLTPHHFGNFAYAFNPNGVLTTAVSYGASTPATITKRIIQYNMLPLLLGLQTTTPNNDDLLRDTNRVQVSELNNPLLFPAKNSYRIGRLSSTVTAIASQSFPVSVGQFGQYPLYVGTSEGVFAMQQGRGDILYQSIQPVSLHSVIDFLGVEGGIIFSTSYGLFILSGSQIEEISIPVEGIPETFINSLPAFTNTETNLPTVISTVGFDTFLNGAVFAHDPINKEIYVSGTDYTYIYSLLYQVWYKSSGIFHNFIHLSGKLLGLSGSKLYDVATPDNSVDVTAWMITRPVKFGSDGLKNISRTILRMIADMADQSVNSLSYHLYGSLNGFEWELIQGKDYTDFLHQGSVVGKEIIIELPQTTARYFIFLLAMKSKVIRLKGFDVDIEKRDGGKLR